MFAYIGKISLSVYLLHIIVLLTISALFENVNSLYIVILSLIIIIIPLSALYQKTVNKLFNYFKFIVVR
jgi:peptidoglycan/LPS O-acetylase OafA/YrhL